MAERSSSYSSHLRMAQSSDGTRDALCHEILFGHAGTWFRAAKAGISDTGYLLYRHCSAPSAGVNCNEFYCYNTHPTKGGHI